MLLFILMLLLLLLQEQRRHTTDRDVCACFNRCLVLINPHTIVLRNSISSLSNLKSNNFKKIDISNKKENKNTSDDDDNNAAAITTRRQQQQQQRNNSRSIVWFDCNKDQVYDNNTHNIQYHLYFFLLLLLLYRIRKKYYQIMIMVIRWTWIRFTLKYQQ